MIIQKTILAQPYYIPLSAHRLTSYTVNVEKDVVTANLQSFFSVEAINCNAQPLAQYSVVIKGTPDEDVLNWLGQQLIIDNAERVSNEYDYPGSYQLADRFMFAGGEIVG